MNIISVILLITFLLIYCLFPMWCAIIMKLTCKSFSDKLIIRFLGIACSLPLLINTIRLTTKIFNELDYDLGIRYAVLGMLFVLSVLFNYFICQALAKLGVIIMNKRIPRQSPDPTWTTPVESGNI